MENFVLYEQVGQGDHYIIYKGRRKDTINFLAIHCAEKCKRSEITNMVRLMHEVTHDNIVKFYEWYETSNHLWLILELCTGGSLEKLIAEDDHLPENSIRRFGLDIVRGLHHIHSIGIIFSDIKPSKILFNGPGDLKFADFGLSRVEGENLEQLLESYADGGEGFESSDCENSSKTERSDVPKTLKTKGTPHYMAPEVLHGEEPSMASDLWSLGCVFYEMFTGHPPFLADNFQQLRDKILNKDLTLPKVKGSRVPSKPSSEFQSLLDGLLEKDGQKRLSWTKVLTHPFWHGALDYLTTDIYSMQSNIRQSFRQSIANFSLQTSTKDHGDSTKGNNDNTLVNSRVGQDVTDSKRFDIDTTSASSKNVQQRHDLLDKESHVLFTLSARPRTAGLEDNVETDEHLTTASAQKMIQQEATTGTRKELDKYEDMNDIASLIYHASDFQVMPIMDVVKKSSLKYDPKALSVPPFSAEKLMSMSSQEQDKHFVTIVESVGLTEKGPPSQKQIQLLNYIATISSSNDQIANALVHHGILTILCRQIKDNQQIEIKTKFCRIVGIIASNVTELDLSTGIGEAISILTEVVRDGFRSSKVKLAVLPALGELLFLVASQDDIKHSPTENWIVNSVTYNLIMKCLSEAEEVPVNLLAAKIIDSVATKPGQHSLKFAVNDVGLQLWHVYNHAAVDSLRVTAVSALLRLSKYLISIVQNLIDKIGLAKLLTAMSLPVSKIQQAIITMIGALIMADVTKLSRIIQDKEFMLQVMRLLESPAVVIRAKAFLVTLITITGNNEQLLAACQNRLVMYVERDRRKQVVGKVDNAEQAEYLNKCLDLLISEMVDAVPRVSKEIITSLDNVSGRKHPSTIQMKLLKNSIPLLNILQHLITSSAFRPKIICESFIKNLSLLLYHVQSMETGVTQLQSATGLLSTEDFIHTVFGIVEIVVQHPSHVNDYSNIVIDHLLPSLSVLVSSCAGDTRSMSLRLFSDISAILLNHETTDATKMQIQAKKLHQLVTESLLPQFEQILLEPDPLPSHGLKLLLALIEQHPVFIRDIERLNLMPVLFQVLVDHQSNPVGFTMQQIAAILNCLVTRKETNMKNLYDHGFVEHFNYMFIEVSSLSLTTEDTGNYKAINTMLLCLLETLHGTLKYVSEIVRRALETRKGGGDNLTTEAEQAEALLLVNKPFIEFVSILTELLVHEDTDIADSSLKCLALLMQFFGGEHNNSLSPKNMECYSESLKKADLKKQKIILRLIKRLIVTDSHHLDMMRQHGIKLADTIKTVAQTASSNGEVALSSLATEILNTTGYKI